MQKQTSPCIEQGVDFHRISFFSMASPCELLIENASNPNDSLVQKLAEVAFAEALRIESKFSRYKNDNLCYQINNAKGKRVVIDEECFHLLEFANECYSASDGLFDITSGILRQAWRFDKTRDLPDEKVIASLIEKVGWQKVDFGPKYIQMPAGMEIDFGGIGKEYAVNRVAQCCREIDNTRSIVVNFGGDIQITRVKRNNEPWVIGIENPYLENASSHVLKIFEGALATSGDAKRSVTINGKRYGHILNPKTGWPVENAPRSVTVAGPQCIQAGCIATMALLQGEYAEEFLKAQNLKYWCVWDSKQ